MPRMLIVDDDASVAKVFAHVGTSAGFEVRTINDPFAVAESYLAFRPDVVMLDLMMPEKDGIDILHELLLAGTDARIIVVSGGGVAMLRLAAEVAVFHASDRVSVMRKPVRRADLTRLLGEMTAAAHQTAC